MKFPRIWRRETFSGSPKYATFYPEMDIGLVDSTTDGVVTYTKSDIGPVKKYFSVFSMLTTPANPTGEGARPLEVFAAFNPIAQAFTGNRNVRVGSLNQDVLCITRDFASWDKALEAAGIVLPADPSFLENGHWGENYGYQDGSGTTVVQMLDVPTSPIMSLAHFAHANLSVRQDEPMLAVGNSVAHPMIDPVSPYGQIFENFVNADGIGAVVTNSDTSWLMNDALFDGYYLSGIASAFSITSSGYNEDAGASIEATLEKFYGLDYKTAEANPVLSPYLPEGINAEDIIDALAEDDGYRKMGAYSLINGAFNVNSTSIVAWTAFLRGNRGLAVTYIEGGDDSGSEDTTPYPRGTGPIEPTNASSAWAGLSRLTDSQIDTLAEEIVEQVKLRGPFMSLSDFVNHRVGESESAAKKDAMHYTGALQAAIEKSDINSAAHTAAAGNGPNANVDYNQGNQSLYFPNRSAATKDRPTTIGAATVINQIDLLLPLAPKISVRSDTFRVRAYGESLADDGVTVIAKAMCEAVVQRVPAYVDPTTDAENNEPWDEAGAPSDSAATTLNETNLKFGRRLKIVRFRWLNKNEI